ncbi:MAG: exopolysaccharide biosynthesis polyprenyl glycosylphosphotransferase [Candidatus Magasanikbacteria bacterium]|nr:exopolysaccharide biosynthesis polyprenyl glycosylphosphotransferase [Candidatus Magasanikbacteria bacterium]
MKRSEVFLMVLQIPVDYMMLIFAAITAYLLRFTDLAISLKPVVFDLSLLDFTEISAIVGIIWILIFALVGLYSTDPNRKFSRDITKVLMACSVGLAAITAYIVFSTRPFDSRFLLLIGWVMAIAYVILGRLLIRGLKALLYRMNVGLRRVVIFGEEKLTGEIVEVLTKRKELGYKIVNRFNKFTTEVEKKLTRMNLDEIIFINPRANEKETLQAIDYCNANHITFKYSADLFDTYSTNMAVSALAGVPVVELKKTRLDGWWRVVKRIFDIVMSLLAIILLSPLMILASVIILIETGRPVIYRNERVGIKGKKFFTLKFRSMYQKDSTGVQFGKSGEEALEKEKKLIAKKSIKKGPVYKIADDPRVTPFGKFIRRFSIDEIPQFFNVLEGTMSIVGPRPHQPREVEKYKKNHRKLLTLKPGITGLAQISGRSDLNFEDEVKLDIFYIENWSLLLDLIIFIKTPFILFKKRRAL